MPLSILSGSETRTTQSERVTRTLCGDATLGANQTSEGSNGAVAVVAQAVWGMARSLTPGRHEPLSFWRRC
jgi:hypothetical protein